MISHGAKTPATLAGVAVGDLLTARGTIDASNPAALVCDVGTACAWRPSYHATFLCRGTVSSVDLQAGTLVVRVAHGSSCLCGAVGARISIDLPRSARIFTLQGRLAAATTIDGVTAGDGVYITGHADCVNSSATMFTADFALVRHAVPACEVTWYACCGQVGATDPQAGTLSVTVAAGTYGVPSGRLTLATTTGSVVRTLSNGVLTTVKVGDLSLGENIAVTGTIDRSHPSRPVYEVGQAFVW